MNWHQYLDHTVSSTFVGKSFPHIDTVQYIGYIMRLMIKNWYIYPPSLGFSKQEPWSGLPFPSPMHESEKWKWSRSVMSDPQWPHGLQPSRLLHPWDFPDKSTGVGCHCLLRVRLHHDLYIVISILYGLSSLIFTQLLMGWHHFHPHFIGGVTEA